jgi:predicted ester cyclase
MTTSEYDYAAHARQAIEIVCSGDLSRMEEFYHPDLVDHVNDMVFHGYAGGRESVAFYVKLFDDLRMGTEEQIAEGGRVASRWVLNGVYHGRPVTLRGITMSRFAKDGRVLEDRGHTDSVALLRQLGLLRTLLLGLEVLSRRVKLPKGVLGAEPRTGRTQRHQ